MEVALAAARTSVERVVVAMETADQVVDVLEAWTVAGRLEVCLEEWLAVALVVVPWVVAASAVAAPEVALGTG